MTGLLVSVRNTAEAVLASAGGAQVIDIKEPTRGSLGPADTRVWQGVCRQLAGARAISVALGELLADRPEQRIAELQSVVWAKIGLAGCLHRDDWPVRWKDVVDQLPAATSPVAVVYADRERAAAPAADQILTRATELGCAAMLVDTFDKSQGGLFDILSDRQLGELIQTARDYSLQVVLAGSLDLRSVPRALAWQPDLIAVRGAACSGSRTGALDQRRVEALAALVAG